MEEHKENLIACGRQKTARKIRCSVSWGVFRGWTLPLHPRKGRKCTALIFWMLVLDWHLFCSWSLLAFLILCLGRPSFLLLQPFLLFNSSWIRLLLAIHNEWDDDDVCLRIQRNLRVDGGSAGIITPVTIGLVNVINFFNFVWKIMIIFSLRCLLIKRELWWERGGACI